MAKFHINKHGVPAPCKAKPGNCPLGGDETHFDNVEDAQAYADKVNESKHGLLPTENSNSDGIKVNVSEEAFNETFPEHWTEGDFEMTGTFTEDIMDETLFRNKDPYKEVREILPEEITKRVEDGKNDYLVSEDNLSAHIKSHITNNDLAEEAEDDQVEGYYPEDGPEEVYREGYNSIVNSFQENAPEELEGNIYNRTLKEGPLKEDLEKYIENKMLEESTLEINGNKVYFEKRDSIGERDWGSEYLKSNEYKEFQKKDMINKLRDPARKKNLAQDAVTKAQDELDAINEVIRSADNQEDKRIAAYDRVKIEDDLRRAEGLLSKLD